MVSETGFDSSGRPIYGGNKPTMIDGRLYAFVDVNDPLMNIPYEHVCYVSSQ